MGRLRFVQKLNGKEVGNNQVGWCGWSVRSGGEVKEVCGEVDYVLGPDGTGKIETVFDENLGSWVVRLVRCGGRSGGREDEVFIIGTFGGGRLVPVGGGNMCLGEWMGHDVTGDFHGTGDVERDGNLISSEEEEKLLLWEVEEEDH